MPIAVSGCVLMLENDLGFSGDSGYSFPEGFCLWRDLRSRNLQRLLTGSILLIQTRQTSLSSFSVGFHSLDRCLGVLTWLHQIAPAACKQENGRNTDRSVWFKRSMFLRGVGKSSPGREPLRFPSTHIRCQDHPCGCRHIDLCSLTSRLGAAHNPRLVTICDTLPIRLASS